MRKVTLVVISLMMTACANTGTTSSTSTISADAINIAPLASASLNGPNQSAGNERVINQRVVALANGSAEIIYALGAGSTLVGRDIASTFAGDLKVPIVTSAHSISAEKVLAQNPTLVITDSRSGPAEALKQIRDAGVTVRSVPDAWTLTDMPEKIAAIGALLGLEQQARELIGQQQQAISELQKDAEGIRVAFLYLRGTASIYLLGGKGSGADALLGGIGAIDVGAQAKLRAFTPLTSEGIVSLNPQVLLVMSKGLESVGGVDGLVKLPGIAQTDAGKYRRVVAVDDSLLLSFGPRTAQLMKLLAQNIKGQMQ